MPVFYLEPKNGDISDRSWEASYLKEGCWVEAGTREVARRRVEGATAKMVDVKLGVPIVYSPWINDRLTDCKQDNPPRPVPAGKVLTKSGKILDIPGQ